MNMATDATVGAPRVKVVRPAVGDTGGLVPDVGFQVEIDEAETDRPVSPSCPR